MSEKQKSRFVRTALAFCVALVGAMFVYKYGARLVSFPLAVGLSALYAVGFTAFASWVISSHHGMWNSRKAYISLVLLVSVAMAALLSLVDRETNQVDRWSAIENFLRYLLAGQYPYAAPTHLQGYGSPFPVWQIWHLPYYFLGNVAYSFVVCWLLFLCAVRRLFGRGAALKTATLLALCPSMWYEVAVCSDLLPNFLLVAAFIFTFQHHLFHPYGGKFLFGAALVCGLLFSTRLSVVVPIFYAFFPIWFQQKWGQRAALLAVAAATFVLTLLPFALWDAQMFFGFEYNPYELQTRQSNVLDSSLLLAAMCLLSFLYLRTPQLSLLSPLQRTDYCLRVARFTGFTLFLFVGFIFLHRFLAAGDEQFWSGAYDHTYFSMCLPFAVVALLSSTPKQ